MSCPKYMQFINKSLNLRRVLGSCEMTRLKSVFIDLSGTLHVDNDQTAGAVEALKRFSELFFSALTGFIISFSVPTNRLRTSDLNIRFVTNTTKESTKTLLDRLIKIGFELRPDEIYSSLNAAINYIKTNNLNPFYILSTDALSDFPVVNDDVEKDAVVIGLSPKDFNYDNMNAAFA